MATTIGDVETLLCPVCQNGITLELLEKLKLDTTDLSTIEELVHEHLLVQTVELGRLASKYFKPDTISAEIQVKDSLAKLSDKATEMIEKQRQLANELVKASEEKKIRLTEEALKKQQDLLIQFQNETRRLQEQNSNTEQEHKHELERMNLAIQQIQQKIIGVGIGQVREGSVIKELQAASREDEFSDEKARKHGADIVASVRVKSSEVGKIVVSVKEHKDWDGVFLDQLKRNLREEQTDWGILVSKVFPSSALNDKMYIETSGILVVKTEYASAAYLGLRHAVIHQFQVQSRLNTQQERDGVHEQALGALKDWVQGNKLKDVFAKIEEARKATVETEDLMQKLQTYNERTVKSSRELQNKIRGWLQESNQILNELEEKLPLTP